MGARTGVVRFLGVPPATKPASGSHVRPSIVDLVVAPQSIKTPLGNWDWESETERKLKRTRRERKGNMVEGLACENDKTDLDEILVGLNFVRLSFGVEWVYLFGG